VAKQTATKVQRSGPQDRASHRLALTGTRLADVDHRETTASLGEITCWYGPVGTYVQVWCVEARSVSAGRPLVDVRMGSTVEGRRVERRIP